jgi:putative membrane protein
MKRIAILTAAAAAGALFAGPALAQNVSTADFVKKAAISDMFEIESSRLALTKNPDADTKPFAEQMVKDHTKTTDELTGMVKSGKVKADLPTAMDDEHKKLLDDLKGKSGKDFDTAYDDAQKKGHRDAVALFQTYSSSGDNADLKKWASDTLPHLKEHLAMADKLK